MKTQLSKFCEDFEALVSPVLGPLGAAAKTLEGTSERLAVRGVLPSIHETRHRLRALAEKVAGQQAYVLIFGPLKSGKSTLMNGIAAAYVSEVTALPAYPCMVYVSHAPERSFTVTHYNGQEETFVDLSSMQTLMEYAHAELAKRLREVEAEGREFDPLSDMPTAIRRVDVRLPAPDLEQSSAVLVDTPGLYSRMRFGYDRMTRDFRDSAACAVFVVKTDNLFLEQVFDEFEQLLELFSRIFLVVNIDTTKRDLRPDGQLGPSLENTDPRRILEAFENLAMSAPLKEAAETGRLKMYPVDLLHAAAARLAKRPAPLETSPLPLEFDGEREADASEPRARSVAAESTFGMETFIESAESGRFDASFDPFLEGLTDYLNSTDYMVAFLGDSLRQASGILGEVEALGRDPRVASLQAEIESLRDDKRHCESVGAALGHLEDVPWDGAFELLRKDLRSITRGRVEELHQETLDRMIDGVDRWTESDGSFQALREDHLRPVLEGCRRDLARAAAGVFETVAGNHTAGAELEEPAAGALADLGLHLGDVGREAAAGLELERALENSVLVLEPQAIPLRKGLLDWLLFRGQAKIRRRVFGPDGRPTRPIPKAEKLRRLGQPGFMALAAELERGLDAFFEEAVERLNHAALGGYVERVKAGVRTLCEERRAANDDLRAKVQRELGELEAARWRLDQLLHTNQTARGRLDELTRQYGETDPETLGLPLKESEPRAGEDAQEPVVELVPRPAPANDDAEEVDQDAHEGSAGFGPAADERAAAPAGESAPRPASERPGA